MMNVQDGVFSSTATIDDVAAAYRLFLRRSPENVGLEHFKGLLSQGMTLERLAACFTTSDEYGNLQKPDLVNVDLGGYSVVLDPRDTEVAASIIQLRDYEPHVRRIIAERFHEGQTFVDLGANVGSITFLAAKIAGPHGRVVSVEPNPTNQQRIYGGVVLNGFDNIHVLPYAASDRRSTLSLTGGFSNTYLVPPKGIDVSTVYAQSIVLDEALAYLPSIDFIKMDVEGFETLALRGFSKLIRQHKPMIIAEFCPHAHKLLGFDPMDMLDMLLDLWKNLTVTSGWDDWIEINDRHELMDYWRKRDAELAAQGILARGMLHFDILGTN